MAKVSIRKEDYERVLEIAERTAKRTNTRVVVAMDRLDLKESSEPAHPAKPAYGKTVELS